MTLPQDSRDRTTVKEESPEREPVSQSVRQSLSGSDTAPLPRPIYDTDISLPASALVERVRDQLARARGQLSDIEHFLGWGEHLKDVEGLLTCGLVALHHTRELMEAAEARADDETRCEICAWPLVTDASKGCVPGNCSYRPERGHPAWHRIRTRRAVLAARAEAALKARSAELAGRTDDAGATGKRSEDPLRSKT